MLLLLLTSTSALLEQKVYQADFENERFVRATVGESSVNYFLTTGEVVKLTKNSDESFVFDHEKIYCWEDCNIYPLIGVDKIVIYEQNQPISILYSKLSNSIGETELATTIITDVYTMEEIEQVSETESNFENIDNNNAPDVSIEEGNPDTEYYSVLWNGTVLIDKEGVYVLSLKSSGGVELYIDGQLLLDYLSSFDGQEKLTKPITISEGEHNLTIKYVNSMDYDKPNLKLNGDVVKKEKLVFKNGGTKKIATKKMTMMTAMVETYALSSTYPTGYFVQPPGGININKRPLILVHGYGGISILASDTSRII